MLLYRLSKGLIDLWNYHDNAASRKVTYFGMKPFAKISYVAKLSKGSSKSVFG